MKRILTICIVYLSAAIMVMFAIIIGIIHKIILTIIKIIMGIKKWKKHLIG